VFRRCKAEEEGPVEEAKERPANCCTTWINLVYFAREVKLLRKPPANRGIKTVPKGRDLINVRPVLATSFVEYLFELSNICRERISALLKS
jgi:hypothetical protein